MDFVKKLFNDPNMSDFKIVDRNDSSKVVFCHKLILSQNEFFKGFFASGVSSDKGVYPVDNIKIATQLVKHIYIGQNDLMANISSYDDFMDAVDLAKMWMMYEPFRRDFFIWIHTNLDSLLNQDLRVIPEIMEHFETHPKVEVGKTGFLLEDFSDGTGLTYKIVNHLQNVLLELPKDIIDWEILRKVNCGIVANFYIKHNAYNQLRDYLISNLERKDIERSFLADASKMLQRNISKFPMESLDWPVWEKLDPGYGHRLELCIKFKQFERLDKELFTGGDAIRMLNISSLKEGFRMMKDKKEFNHIQASAILSCEVVFFHPTCNYIFKEFNRILLIRSFSPFKAEYFVPCGVVVGKSKKWKTILIQMSSPVRRGQELYFDGNYHEINKIVWEGDEVDEALQGETYSMGLDCLGNKYPDHGTRVFVFQTL